MKSDEAKAIEQLTKEVHELNRKLDRLCQASIFSVDTPTVYYDLSPMTRSCMKSQDD